MEGWMDGRMEGRKEAKAGLRIAYSNQQSLQKQNFRLLINAPTHEAGNTLDNIAINFDDQQSLEVYHHALYCSDHDAICFRI